MPGLEIPCLVEGSTCRFCPPRRNRQEASKSPAISPSSSSRSGPSQDLHSSGKPQLVETGPQAPGLAAPPATPGGCESAAAAESREAESGPLARRTEEPHLPWFLCLQVLEEKRNLGRKDGPPHLVVLVPLHAQIDPQAALNLFQSNQDSVVFPAKGGPPGFALLCPRSKLRWRFVVADAGEGLISQKYLGSFYTYKRGLRSFLHFPGVFQRVVTTIILILQGAFMQCWILPK